MRIITLVAILLTTQVYAQILEETPSVIIPDPSPDDHSGQDMSAESLTLTAGSTEGGIILNSDARICLNGALCTKRIYYSSSGGGIVMNGDFVADSLTLQSNAIINGYISNASAGQPVYMLDPEGVRFHCTNTLYACGTYVPTGTLETLCSDYSMHVCTPSGWQELASSMNTQFVSAGKDIGPERIAIQAPAATKGIQFLHNSIMDFGTGANDECYSDGAKVNCSIFYFGQVGVNQINPSSGDRTTFIGAEGLRLLPLGDGATCAGSSDTGTISASNSTGKFHYCNGATKETVAFTQGPWSSSLDFDEFTTAQCKTLTYSASGLTSTTNIASSGCSPIEDSDIDLLCSISPKSDEIKVKVCCFDGAGCGDPSSTTFSAQAVR